MPLNMPLNMPLTGCNIRGRQVGSGDLILHLGLKIKISRQAGELKFQADFFLASYKSPKLAISENLLTPLNLRTNVAFLIMKMTKTESRARTIFLKRNCKYYRLRGGN